MFTFNGVFGENATQAEVFKPVEKLIESALIGYKVTIFAFGQTGSGKTYTMSGGPDKKDGLIQQTFAFLRSKLTEESEFEFKISCTMVQVYYSKITDLLLKKGETFRRLIIEKDEKYDITNITGATKVLIDFENPEALAQIWKQGLDNRTMRASDFNETSSRSHLMFAINIERTKKGSTEPFDIGKIIYIDLAGSECL
jgi:hypothetical protein